jgi:hypothetical protein
MMGGRPLPTSIPMGDRAAQGDHACSRRVGLSPVAKVLDLKARFRWRRCGRKGRAVVSIKWRGQSAVRAVVIDEDAR